MATQWVAGGARRAVSSVTRVQIGDTCDMTYIFRRRCRIHVCCSIEGYAQEKMEEGGRIAFRFSRLRRKKRRSDGATQTRVMFLRSPRYHR